MDVRESKQALQKQSAVESLETLRPPLVSADKNNGTTGRSRTKEVTSRYRSSIPSTPSGPRRFPSPNVTRTASASSQLVPKRAISAERKRPYIPPSPKSPSTPVHDTSTEMQLSSRKTMGSRLPDALWPSTMRSLSVSFQSDTFSLPISKREKPVTHALLDRTLKPSSNAAHKQVETPPVSRKPTPERKRSPLKGKNAADQSENSKPVDGLHARLVDQHRWPSRTGGKVSSSASTRSMDLTDKTGKTSTLSHPGNGISSLRRMSVSDSTSKPLRKAASDTVRLASFDEIGRVEFEASLVNENSPWESGLNKLVSSSSLERTTLMTPAVKSRSTPTPVSRPASPNKTPVLSSSVSRGVSPSRTRSLNPTPSRGVSPSLIRPSSPSRQSNSSTSVLSFIVDIRKGKKGANHIEDAHQLRLLYNRHLQWRYANARADASLYNQKVTSEVGVLVFMKRASFKQETLYNVWRTTSHLRDSVTETRIDLQQLMLKLKLYSVLNEQMAYLDGWALIERDHISSLSQASEDLQASTLRLPITRGARADIETVKAAVCSAIDVMQAMGSSICSILSRVEGTNCLVSELADLAVQERAMLDECEALLASTAAMQVEEYSLRTHLIQLKQAWRSGDQSILAIKTPSCVFPDAKLTTLCLSS